MSEYFDDYDIKYPDLVLKILEYFDIQNTNVGRIMDKSVMKFCEQYKAGNSIIYQPNIVNRICKRLCDCRHMECVQDVGIMGLKANYMFATKNKNTFEKEKFRLKYILNSEVYGFEYIYRMYKDIVIPLVWDKILGDRYLKD